MTDGAVQSVFSTQRAELDALLARVQALIHNAQTPSQATEPQDCGSLTARERDVCRKGNVPPCNVLRLISKPAPQLRSLADSPLWVRRRGKALNECNKEVTSTVPNVKINFDGILDAPGEESSQKEGLGASCSTAASNGDCIQAVLTADGEASETYCASANRDLGTSMQTSSRRRPATLALNPDPSTRLLRPPSDRGLSRQRSGESRPLVGHSRVARQKSPDSDLRVPQEQPQQQLGRNSKQQFWQQLQNPESRHTQLLNQMSEQSLPQPTVPQKPTRLYSQGLSQPLEQQQLEQLQRMFKRSPLQPLPSCVGHRQVTAANNRWRQNCRRS